MTVACFNREWRTHGATSESLRPEPKGEGTVWQRTLIRPNRTHQKRDSTQRGETLVNQPGFYPIPPCRVVDTRNATKGIRSPKIVKI
jgi:hypothetical protein